MFNTTNYLVCAYADYHRCGFLILLYTRQVTKSRDEMVSRIPTYNILSSSDDDAPEN